MSFKPDLRSTKANISGWKLVIAVFMLAAFLGALSGLFIPHANGQSILPQPGGFNTLVQTQPAAMPTSLTCLVGYASACTLQLTRPVNSPGPYQSDPYVCQMDVTANGQTVLVEDGQGTPVPLISGTLGTSGAAASWFYGPYANDTFCRWMPNGVYVQAGSSGVTYHMTVKYNR